MAAPDSAFCGIIYNAMDSQTQDEIIQDLQSMNVNSTYAIIAACQMGRSKSILITFVGTTTLSSAIIFDCGVYRCHPFRPKAEACMNCWTSGHRADVYAKPKSALCYRCSQAHKTVEPPDLRFFRNGLSPQAKFKPQSLPAVPPNRPILKTSRPSHPATDLPPVVPGLPGATTPSPSQLCLGPRHLPSSPPHNR
ncbi:hypothetical protein HPB50_008861 [Hyalomma asiaticum]|uniref:Uncharacterized protein n=1 Tax=Hyalomma asiaticum TaxID=266040 RepID=A0ACB7SUS6_HYAAI|nr:hypothetical protein HPB50_008861 [Hyalomma asiaticum]